MGKNFSAAGVEATYACSIMSQHDVCGRRHSVPQLSLYRLRLMWSSNDMKIATWLHSCCIYSNRTYTAWQWCIDWSRCLTSRSYKLCTISLTTLSHNCRRLRVASTASSLYIWLNKTKWFDRNISRNVSRTSHKCNSITIKTHTWPSSTTLSYSMYPSRSLLMMIGN